MDRQVTFEVHVFQKKRWEIHARHDDPDPAIEEAKALDMLASIDEVKVVRDTYDPDTAESLETVVYRSPKGQKRKISSRSATAKLSRKTYSGLPENFEDGFNFFGDRRTSPKKVRRKKPQTFTTTLIKVLLIILFGVTIAGFMAFGSIAFLRDTSFSNNVQTNIIFMIFVVTFLLSTVVMALSFLKKDTLGRSVRPRGMPKSRPPGSADKLAGKPAGKRSPLDVGAPGAPPSAEALASYADQAQDATEAEMPEQQDLGTPELPSGDLAEQAEPAEQELPKIPFEPAPEATEKPDTTPIDKPRLPAHAEHQRLSLIKFLSESLKKMQADTSKFDSFNKFGINLYLAGAIEGLGQKSMLDIRSVSIILSETVAIIGFKKAEAEIFAEKYEQYLLADSRYMQMFQAGRNAMNTYLEGGPEAVTYLEQALTEWNRPKSKDENVGPVTVLFTDIAGSTAMTQELGDAIAQQVVRAHNRIVREALTDFNGKEIKHTGDGIMASFSAVSSGVEAAIRMQQDIATHNRFNPDLPLHVKIGINAGEPIAEDNDLFGSTVQMAARIVDKAGKDEIFVSEIVRGICEGKKLHFKDRGQFEMKGFEAPPTLYEVLWKK